MTSAADASPERHLASGFTIFLSAALCVAIVGSLPVTAAGSYALSLKAKLGIEFQTMGFLLGTLPYLLSTLLLPLAGFLSDKIDVSRVVGFGAVAVAAGHGLCSAALELEMPGLFKAGAILSSAGFWLCNPVLIYAYAGKLYAARTAIAVFVGVYLVTAVMKASTSVSSVFFAFLLGPDRLHFVPVSFAIAAVFTSIIFLCLTPRDETSRRVPPRAEKQPGSWKVFALLVVGVFIATFAFALMATSFYTEAIETPLGRFMGLGRGGNNASVFIAQAWLALPGILATIFGLLTLLALSQRFDTWTLIPAFPVIGIAYALTTVTLPASWISLVLGGITTFVVPPAMYVLLLSIVGRNLRRQRFILSFTLALTVYHLFIAASEPLVIMVRKNTDQNSFMVPELPLALCVFSIALLLIARHYRPSELGNAETASDF